jgi:hypothetical protein
VGRLLLPLLLLLLIVVLATLSRQLNAARARRPAELAAARWGAVVDAVKERAWADRDVSPALAAALIERVREASAGGRPADAMLVDDLREIAWSHRDSDPELSVVVLDLIRHHS